MCHRGCLGDFPVIVDLPVVFSEDFRVIHVSSWIDAISCFCHPCVMRGFRVSVIHRAMRGFPIIHLPFYFSQSLNDDSNYTPLRSKLTPIE